MRTRDLYRVYFATLLLYHSHTALCGTQKRNLHCIDYYTPLCARRSTLQYVRLIHPSVFTQRFNQRPEHLIARLWFNSHLCVFTPDHNPTVRPLGALPHHFIITQQHSVRLMRSHRGALEHTHVQEPNIQTHYVRNIQ